MNIHSTSKGAKASSKEALVNLATNLKCTKEVVKETTIGKNNT